MSPRAAGTDPGSDKASAVAWPDPGSEKAAAVPWPDPRCRLEQLAAAAEARAGLARRLEAAIEARRESVRQGAALDELRRRLDLRRARADELVAARRKAAEGVDRCREELQARIGRVLPLSRALAAAHRQVQDAKEGLSAEKARLGDLQKLLRTRQQSMVAQVAALYPVRVFREPLPVAENHRSHANGEGRTSSEENGPVAHENGNRTHLLSAIKSPHIRPSTFFGWQIWKPKAKQPSYSHKELQRSAAVLGYAAHAVLLIASYLDVPLRYPLHFGGSRSYVGDRLPLAETSSAASAEHPRVGNADSKLTDYPLFLEFQDDSTTRSSYAIYLFHKDTEQLLNYIGAEGSGKNVFGNLRELIRIIQSDEYLYI